MRDMSKDELFNSIEQFVCKRCPKYNSGEFCSDCRLCNISVVYQVIELLSETDKDK